MRRAMDTKPLGSFDVPGERLGWHTALYYFAEHIRHLSRGHINHKILYSYLGVNGHYINHDNPTIRRRTAAMLSRLIHSRRYVEDFSQSFSKNARVFDEAAGKLCRGLGEWSDCGPAELIAYFSRELWHDVERGLGNERDEGRVDINLARVANEMHALFAWCAQGAEDEAAKRLAVMASSYFRLLTFGHLDEGFISQLVDETPLEIPEVVERLEAQDEVGWDSCACLVKYPRDNEGVISNWWVVDARRPFSIGRFTDCDVIETNCLVSRVHCRLVHDDGEWHLEDRGSTHGTRVLRGGDSVVYDSARDGAVSCALQRGDRFVLARTSHYWFGALTERRVQKFVEKDGGRRQDDEV